VAALWEYTIREFVQEWGDPGEGRAAAAFLAELNDLGQLGWEAVGLAPRTHYDRGGGPPGWDSFSFVVLLKRETLVDAAPDPDLGASEPQAQA
jgi:hypothetical protein